MFNKALLLFLFKVIFTALVVGLLVHNLNVKELLAIMEKSSWVPFLISLIFIWAGLGVAAKRWSCVLSAQSTPPTFFHIYRQVMLGFFFNQLLPSSIGGDAYRAVSLKQYGIPLDWSFASTIIDRIYGLLTLVVVATLAIPFQFHVLEKTVLGEIMLISFALVLCGLVGLLCLQYIPIRWPKPLAFVVGFSKTLRLVFFNGKSWYTLFVSIISTVLLMTPYKILANDMDLSLSFSQIFVSIPLVLLISVLPISFAGWGLREGAMVLTLHVFGISKESALAFSLMIGGLQIVAAIPGIGLWFLKKKQPIQ
jgi:hypothetical protein